jgi:hypothetical protein
MQTPGRREAEFIGKVTASATHEIRNVLAIVKESAGLIEDLVRASSRAGRGTSHDERILKAAGRIDAQVARGAEIVTRLNRFAHSTDEASGRVDLAEEIREVAFLSQRFARAKRQTVEAAAPDGAVWLTGSSLQVQMALFAAVTFCLADLPEGAFLSLHATGGNGVAAEAGLSGSAEPGAVLPRPAESPGWASLDASLAALGVGLRTDGERGYGLRLSYGEGG